MTCRDEIRKLSQNYSASGFAANQEWEAMYRHGWNACEEVAAEIAARADARIAELEQSAVIRDTELARLETDLELARIGARRYETARRMNVPMWKDALKLNLSTGRPFDEIIDELRPFMFPHDAARAGNGGGA